MGTRTQPKTVKRPRSSGSSLIMDSAMPKCRTSPDDMNDAAEQVTKKVEVIEEDHVMETTDVAEPAASSLIGFQVAEGMTIVSEPMFTICPFPNVQLRELVEAHERTNGNFLLDYRFSTQWAVMWCQKQSQ